LKAPGGVVRPTQDKVRAALFSMLAPRIAGTRFLDLYAGSGAVGLEALSRGAGTVCWVEINPRVAAVLSDNIKGLCGAPGLVFKMDAIKFLKKRLVAEAFDTIFCDPPYDKEGRGGALTRLLEATEASGLLAQDGLFIMEQDADEPVEEPSGWKRVDLREYGNTRLSFLKRVRGNSP
jgi:16S rRNA (guanine966-N2)-methyltransferase